MLYSVILVSSSLKRGSNHSCLCQKCQTAVCSLLDECAIHSQWYLLIPDSSVWHSFASETNSNLDLPLSCGGTNSVTTSGTEMYGQKGCLNQKKKKKKILC